MEQYIDIKYINNLINLGYNNINSFPLNLSNEKNNQHQKKEHIISKIIQIENIKTKILLIIDNYQIIYDPNELITYKNSFILQYDVKTEAFATKSFPEKKIDDLFKMFLIEDDLYCILGTKIVYLDTKLLDVIREWDIGEKLYYFCFFENNPTLKINLDIFYVNYQNELKFFGKSFLFEIKQKTLYKEQYPIDKILFENGLLMWSSFYTIKIFDLKNKQMLLRKTYDDVKEEISKLTNLTKLENVRTNTNEQNNSHELDRNSKFFLNKFCSLIFFFFTF